METLQDSGNSSGTLLVSWQEVREGSEETCASSVAEAAIGSPATGFAETSVSKMGVLARPTGVFLDDAGDGWIVGTREKFHGFVRYGPTYQNSGAWLAFRPAGGVFRPAVALSVSKADIEPFIVGDGAGAVLVGWNTDEGAELQWGDRTGRLFAPHFFRSLTVSSLGIDDRGVALIAGRRTPRGKRPVDLLINGRLGGFSHPDLLARAPRTPPWQETPATLSPPTVRVGPAGQALIMWQFDPDPGPHEEERMLVYRSPAGKLGRPIRYPGYRLPEPENPGELRLAALDGSGRAALLVDEDSRAYLTTFSPTGRLDRLRQPLTASKDFTLGVASVAANAAGEFVATWIRHGSIQYALGTEPAALPAPEAITAPPGASDFDGLVTISRTGEAVAVWRRLFSLTPREEAIEAQTLAPGAAPIQIAFHKPLH
jgi:hypothetical protein